MGEAYSLIKSQKGSTFIISLMVLLVFSILIVAFLNIGFFEEKAAISNEKHKQAYYLARSGQEIALSMIKMDGEELNYLPVYLYGSLSGGFTFFRGAYDTTHNDESIVAVIEGENGSGTITSYGNVNGIVEKVVFTFNYGTVLVPGTPPPPPPEGLDAGSSDGDAVSWFQSNNGNIIHGGGAYDGAVIFQNENNGAVITLQNSSSTLSAYSMYFTDTPISLEVSPNSTLTLVADLLSFSGKVNIDDHNQEIHNGQLILKVNNSVISGQTIGGQIGVKYGVIYLGDEVQLGGIPFSGIEANNYYYFPHNVNINSQSGIDELIKINDISSIDFEMLGIGMSSGGISPGLYK